MIAVAVPAVDKTLGGQAFVEFMLRVQNRLPNRIIRFPQYFRYLIQDRPSSLSINTLRELPFKRSLAS